MLVLLATAACGEERIPPERLVEVARATVAGGSAAFTVRMTVGGNPVFVTGDGREGPEEDRVAGGGNAGTGPGSAPVGLTATGRGVIDFEAGLGRLELGFPAAGSSVTLLRHDGNVYLRLPEGLAGEGVAWIRQETAPVAGLEGGTELAGDPSRIVSLLERAAAPISTLGEDTLRGERVRGYAFTVRGRELWSASEEAPPSLRDLEVPVRVWVDARDRARRIELSIDLASMVAAAREQLRAGGDTTRVRQLDLLGAFARGSIGMTTEFHAFGTPVSIEPPDPSEVMDIETFRRRVRDDTVPAPGSGGQGKP